MYTKGQLVYSKCGRDARRLFIVIDFDEEYVFVVDGKLRLLSKPKKKKKKHVQIVNKIDYNIKQKLDGELHLMDSDIRSAIDAYINQL